MYVVCRTCPQSKNWKTSEFIEHHMSDIVVVKRNAGTGAPYCAVRAAQDPYGRMGNDIGSDMSAGEEQHET